MAKTASVAVILSKLSFVSLSRFRKDLSALRVPSPFQRPLKVMAQDSLEMELGASATGVHQISQIPLCHAQPKEESGMKKIKVP